MIEKSKNFHKVITGNDKRLSSEHGNPLKFFNGFSPQNIEITFQK